MNFTVPGAAGFLGRQVWETLLAAGHTIRATDKAQSPGRPGPLVLADLLDAAAGPPLVDEADVMAHLATMSVITKRMRLGFSPRTSR